MNLSVVIHTCDKYNFLWDNWYYYFSKYWNFSIVPNVYFLNENIDISFNNIKQIKTGSGEWSDRLTTGLNQIPEDNIFYMQEDFWPTERIKENTFIQLFKYFIDLQMNCFSIQYNSLSSEKLGMVKTDFVIDDESIYKIPKHIRYVLSHQPAIWNKNYFLSQLQFHETPWQNEKNGSIRISKSKEDPKIYFYGLRWYACCYNHRTGLEQCGKLLSLIKNKYEILDDFWKIEIEKLKKFNGTNIKHLAAYVRYPLEKNNEQTNQQLEIINHFFDLNNKSILEMGAGFGNLCYMISEKKSNIKYTILDTDQMIKFSKHYLQNKNTKCNFVDIMDCEQVISKNYDLFISNNCLTETPEKFRKLFIEFLFSGTYGKINNVFIIDGSKDETFKLWLSQIIKQNYSKLYILDGIESFQNIFIGVDKK